MLMQRKTCWLLVLGLLLGTPLARAAQPMIFQHLGVNEGLPQNTVNATLQDSQGFIWVATEDGLVRYDGYETRHYAVERGKPGSLPGNYVWAMAEDRAGDLWLVIKNGGLVRWSRSTERFTTFRHDPARPDASPASDAIRQLLIDRRGHIWLATTGSGLDDFDPATGKFKHYRHDAGRPDSLSSDVVTTLWQTPEGALWVGTDNGLNHWLPAADGFLSFHHDPRDVHSLSSNGITAISVDRRGRLWVGTYNNGINVGDKDGSRFTGYRHKPKDARSLPDDEVRAVLEDRDGRVWIGTAAGLALFDEQAGGFDIYTRDSAEPTSLRDDYVMSLLEDHAGLLWVGTRAGGVSRWDPHTWLLGHQKPAGLANDYVNAFAEDRQGRIWVGTREGLVRFDAATGNWTPFERVRLSGASLGDRRIMSLLTDRNGNLWIGTMTAGLYRLSPEGAVRVWRAARGHPQALAADGIMALCEDSRGRLWIGTFGGGVSILDPATDRFQNLAYDPKDPGSLGAPNATAIIEDGGGNIWVGSDGGGLNIIRPDGTVAALFRHQPDQADSLSANSIYALQRDATGRLWVGTDGGGIDLVIGSSAKPSAVRFKPVTQQQGLSSNVVYGIRSDGQRGLWLSGNSGLMRYDPETGAVRQFHREQGLQGEEFNFGAHYRTRDGRLLFGGANGFNMIAPEHLQARNAPPTPVLTGVQIMNHPAALATPYPLLASLNLKHAESVVSFDFSALDYSAPDKIRYAYRLRGFDPDFIELRQGHSVSYTNLDAGTYLLELKAGNSDGAWSRSVLHLPVRVAPPLWLTSWAYLLYGAALLGLLFAWHSAHARKLAASAAAQRRLEAEVALRTRDLEERNLELARVTRTKSDFLARMSHEIRTPMNGVLGTAELLAGTMLTTRQARLAGTIQSSARTLLSILNDILDLAKVEAGKLSLEAVPFDFAMLIEDTVELLAPQAQRQQVDIIASPPAELRYHVIGDPLRIRQLLSNLLGNAIKFTIRGQILVAVRVSGGAAAGDSLEVELSVSDTGIGMSQEVLAQVFEPFTQADEATTRRFGGTGLGLAICRELVALMDGRIAATSEPDVGSTFTVSLQLQRGEPLEEPDLGALRGIGVRVASRRPALRDALLSQIGALGMPVQAAGNELDIETSAGARAELVIIDADSLEVELTAALAGSAGQLADSSLFICAPGSNLRRMLEARLGEDRLLANPLSRRALLAALRAAAGIDATEDATTEQTGSRQRFAARVLVVEDSPVNQLVAEEFLSTLGCSVTCVSNAREAIARATTETYGLIFMDLNMPEMDGLTATGLIRRSERAGTHVPIVALTANASATHRDRCLAAGLDDFLGKPYTRAALQTVLAKWLPAPAAGHAPPVANLDRKVLASIRSFAPSSQEDLLSRLLPVFRRSSAQYLDTIREALPRGDHDAIRASAHALKSSAAHLGAIELAAAARNLEHADDPVQIARLAADIFRLHAAAITALEREVLRESA